MGAVLGFHPVLDDSDAGTTRELQVTWTGLEAHDQSQGFGQLILSADGLAVSPQHKLSTTWGCIRLEH